DEDRIFEPFPLHCGAQLFWRKRGRTDCPRNVETLYAFERARDTIARRSRDRIGMIETGPTGGDHNLPGLLERFRADIGITDMVEQHARIELRRLLQTGV